MNCIHCRTKRGLRTQESVHLHVEICVNFSKSLHRLTYEHVSAADPMGNISTSHLPEESNSSTGTSGSELHTHEESFGNLSGGLRSLDVQVSTVKPSVVQRDGKTIILYSSGDNQTSLRISEYRAARAKMKETTVRTDETSGGSWT